jgi:hypothetical protein
LTLLTVAGRPLLEHWSDTVLSYCPAFRAPNRLIDVQAVNNRDGIDVRLSNAADANLKNVKVTIYLPKVNNISFKNDEVYAFGSYLVRDDIRVFQPGQVKTYHIDPNQLPAGADLNQIHYFAGGYYRYILNLTHFGTDQPLFSSYQEQ